MDTWFGSKEHFARPALLFEPATEKRFVSDPPSLLGAVTVALPGEDWPTFRGAPLLPVLQVNLSNLPFRPSAAKGIELLTLFLDPERRPETLENGSGWCLRTYRNIAALEALADPRPNSERPVVWLGLPVLVEDFPGDSYREGDIDPSLWQHFKDSHPIMGGLKLGGWPPLPPADLFEGQVSTPDYVLQWEHEACGGLMLLGRGTKAGMKDKWVFQWQCKDKTPRGKEEK